MYLDLSLSYVGMPEELTTEQPETAGMSLDFIIALHLKHDVSALN